MVSDKDVIYRQDAIDAIMSEPPDAHYPSWYADILWKLPSAEPRKKGKWIKRSDGLILKRRWGVCSVCGNTLDFAGVNAGRGDANYCPNCGADMIEGESDE